MTSTNASSASAGSDNAGPRGHAGGLALVLLAGLFWSSGGTLIRLTEAVDPWIVVAYRSIFVTLFFVAIIVARYGRAAPLAFLRVGWIGVLAGLCLGLTFTGYIVSVSLTTVANALFMFGAAPLFAAVLARVMLGERATTTTWCAIAVAIAGITLMVHDGLAAQQAAGSLVALASSFGFALYGVLIRRAGAGDSMPTVAYAGAVATAVAIAVLHGPGGSGLGASARDVALCLAMAVGQLGLGFVLFSMGARTVPAAELMLLALIEPIVSPVWVWLAVGEVPSTGTLVGGGVVAAAIVLLAVDVARRSR
ncbi:MAG: EamA family transporter [Alphaproteobacteria bacterium]|nr:EamA family transporter [Alphaproteobacteria bacterium]